MPATREEARTQATALVEAAALSAGVAAANIIKDADRRSIPKTNPPVPWVRITFRHQSSSKTSLTGRGGLQRFTRVAILTVQTFENRDAGIDNSDTLAVAIQNSLEAKTTAGGLQFFDVTANEAGEDGPWYNANITARVEYDEFVNT